MEKSSKCKNIAKEYGISVLTGTTILLILFALATSVQAFLMLTLLGLGLGTVLYILWRII